MHTRSTLATLLVFSLFLAACGSTPPKSLAGADGGAVTPTADGGATHTAPDGGSLACDPLTNKSSLRIHRIVNGTRMPTHVPLGEAQQLAVIGVEIGRGRGASCTGTLIAERAVITAKHCTEGTSASNIFILFGVDDSNPVLRAAVTSKVEHATRDIAMLVLPSPPSASIDVRPIPIALEDLTSADVGITVENAGYGNTSPRGGSDGRFFVAEPLVELDRNGEEFVVDGEGRHGVCFGDSGGPSLRIAPAGDTRLIGVLSAGDDSCVGLDVFARVDPVRAFVEETAGPTPGAGPQPCGSLTAEGTCNATGSIASFCEGGIQQHRACASGESCGFSAQSNGFRCISLEQNPCGGVTRYGSCDGMTLRWCDRNVLRVRDCAACGERCLQTSTDGFKCLASNCGDLTYQGRCEGTTAVWCNESGQRETIDCGARGQMCGFVNNDVGYYCQVTNNCGDVTFQGFCDGNVAVNCRNGEVRRRDCTARGQTCGLIDAQRGYNCQ